MKIYDDIVQGSDEWFKIKCGVVSSSLFSKVLNKKEGRRTYMFKLAGERDSGIVDSAYYGRYMQMGNLLEDEARSRYELVSGVKVRQVGFITKNEDVGASTDGLIGEKGILEIKSVIPSTQVATVLSGKMPTIHKPQVQGEMYVTDREWVDFFSYCPASKSHSHFCKRVYRDDDYINNILEPAIIVFVKELKEIMNKLTKPAF